MNKVEREIKYHVQEGNVIIVVKLENLTKTVDKIESAINGIPSRINEVDAKAETRTWTATNIAFLIVIGGAAVCGLILYKFEKLFK